MKLLSSVLILFAATAAVAKRVGAPANAVSSSREELYVVSYAQTILSLDDLVDLLNDFQIEVEGQLSCTRGVVVRIDNGEIAEKISSMQGIELYGYGSTHAAPKNGFTHDVLDRRTRGIEPTSCRCDSFKDPDTFSLKEAKTIWNAIIREIKRDGDCFDGSITNCARALLRNALHDAAAMDVGSDDHKLLGGANRCGDHNPTHPGNDGLANANAFLKKVQEGVFRQLGKYMSMSDLIAIGGSAAVKATGGPRIVVKLGRKDIPCGCQETVLPPAESAADASDIVTSTARRLGLNADDHVALMGGAHTIGRLDPAKSYNSGYLGNLVPGPDAALFTNTYFWGMFCIPWLKISRNTFNDVPLTEWTVDPSLGIGDITFLNTDAVLAFQDLENCDLFGGVNHLPPGVDPSICNVPQPDGTMAPIPDDDIPGTTRCQFRSGNVFDQSKNYFLSQELFFQKFGTAYQKLMDTTAPCGGLYDAE